MTASPCSSARQHADLCGRHLEYDFELLDPVVPGSDCRAVLASCSRQPPLALQPLTLDVLELLGQLRHLPQQFRVRATAVRATAVRAGCTCTWAALRCSQSIDGFLVLRLPAVIEPGLQLLHVSGQLHHLGRQLVIDAMELPVLIRPANAQRASRVRQRPNSNGWRLNKRRTAPRAPWRAPR